MTVVIAFGGSILAPADPKPEFLLEVAHGLKTLAQKQQILVSVGGGSPARRAITAAREIHVGEEELDRIGVAATRLNAQILASVLYAHGANVNREIPTTVAAAIALLGEHQIMVMGGTTPGHSTDFVAASLAVAANANRLVIATNVDGVYSTDPKRDPEAKRLAELTFDDLLGIVGETAWTTAGSPGVVDGPATLVLAENAMTTCVVLGTDLDEVMKAATGEPFHGSIITGSKVIL